jgi:hypothetical protein
MRDESAKLGRPGAYSQILTEPTQGGRADPTVVDQVVTRINSISRAATFDFAMAVGSLIIESFYGGDLAAWRDRGPKDASFRKLAKHPALPMSPGALYRSVAMYELCRRLGISAWKHVSTSHLRLVLPLHSEEQERLLTSAEENRWPVRRMEEEIAVVRQSQPADSSHGGRKRRSRLVTTVQALEKWARASCNISSDPDTDSSPESARLIIDALQRVRSSCAQIEEKVTRRLEPANQASPSGTHQVPPLSSRSPASAHR